MTTMTDKELLVYILERTNLKTFNSAIRRHNLQVIYESQRNHLLYEFFGGMVLKYSTRMAEIFNEIQTNEQAFISADLEKRIDHLKFHIKYNRDDSQSIQEHNMLVWKFKEVNVGVNNMVKLYKKIYKAKTTKKWKLNNSLNSTSK